MPDNMVAQVLLDTTTKVIEQEEYRAYAELKQQVDSFLKNYNDIIIKENQIIMKLEGQSIIQDLTTLYARMRASQDFTRELLQIQWQFEHAIDTFLQRQQYLTYVQDSGTDAGKIIALSDFATFKLYTEYATAQRGRGNISVESMNKLIESANQLVQENTYIAPIQQKLNKATRGRIGVYRTALAMYNDSNTHQFYWHINSKAESGYERKYSNRYANTGPIAEGYVRGVILEDPDMKSKYAVPYPNNGKQDGPDGYKALRALERHISVNSVAGLIRGDVQMQFNGEEIHLAIKKGSFSTARFGQYVRLAYNLNQINFLTHAQLSEFLPKLISFSKISQRIIEQANQYAESYVIEHTVDKIKNL